MNADYYFLTLLLILIVFVEKAKSQSAQKAIAHIKHSVVGNDVIQVCNKTTIGAKGDVFANRWNIIFANNNVTTSIFSGHSFGDYKHLNFFDNVIVSFERSKDKFELILIIKAVSKKNEGSYACEIEYQNTRTGSTSTRRTTMMYLYVHNTEENNLCKDNWLYYEPLKTCVRLNLDSMGWSEGRKFCKFHHNADMVRITSLTFDYYISSLSDPEASYWIGLKSEKGKIAYQWLDDVSSPNIFFSNWASKYPKYLPKVDKCVAKGGLNGTWRNMACKVNNGVICERSTDKKSVWRAPPLWKVVVMSAIMIAMVTIFALCFLGIWPRSAFARTLGYLGRTDVVSEVMAASTVVVLYDSELNDLLTYL